MKILEKKAKTLALNLLKKSKCKELPFHSIKHTIEVYNNVEHIAKYEGLSADHIEMLKLAALFHDTGMALGFKDHEEISAINAALFLEEHNYPIDKIEVITNCIRATKIPQTPRNLLEAILCDADLFHLGSANYMSKNELLRKEWETYNNLNFTDSEWIKLNVNFFKEHKFHTDYGNTILKRQKTKNQDFIQYTAIASV